MHSDDSDKAYRVSAVIPAHNAGRTLARTLDSILAQTHPPDEIVVVDNGSTDDTAAVAEQHKAQVRYVYQEDTGPAGSRNTGINTAAHPWVAFLDADDEWRPEKLELQLQLLKRNPDLVWAYTNYSIHYDDGNRRRVVHDPDRLAEVMNGKDRMPSYFEAVVARCSAWTCTLIVKKEIFTSTGLFDPNLTHGVEDTDMWFRIAFDWPQVGYVSKPLSIYHMDVPDRYSANPRPLAVLSHRLARLLRLAGRHERLAEFKPCAAIYVQNDIEMLLWNRRRRDALKLIGQFSDLLPFGYRTEVRLRAMLPRIAPRLLRIWNRHKPEMAG